MTYSGVGLLFLLTGTIVWLAVDAVRWRLPRRLLLVGVSLPLTLLSCAGLWVMQVYPQWLNPTWHGASRLGFRPDWDCSGFFQRGLICVRKPPPRLGP